MHFSALSILAALAATGASAAAIDVPTTSVNTTPVATEPPVYVYDGPYFELTVYTEASFEGREHKIKIEPRACNKFTPAKGRDISALSAKNPAGAFYCIYYGSDDCTGLSQQTSHLEEIAFFPTLRFARSVICGYH